MQMLMLIHMQQQMQIQMLTLIHKLIQMQMLMPIQMLRLILIQMQIHMQMRIHRLMQGRLFMQQLNQNLLLLTFLLQNHFQLFKEDKILLTLLQNSFLKWLMVNFQEISICIMTQLLIKDQLKNQLSLLNSPMFLLNNLKIQEAQLQTMMVLEKLTSQFMTITLFTSWKTLEISTIFRQSTIMQTTHLHPVVHQINSIQITFMQETTFSSLKTPRIPRNQN